MRHADGKHTYLTIEKRFQKDALGFIHCKIVLIRRPKHLVWLLIRHNAKLAELSKSEEDASLTQIQAVS